MADRKILCIIFSIFIVNKTCDKIILPKYLVAYLFKLRLLSIINANRNNTIRGKELARQAQPGIYHRAPIRMKSPASIRVCLRS